MKPALIHQSGSLRGRKNRIRAEVTRLGRKKDNDIVFAENVVSSYHAEIRERHGSCLILDLGSTNGIYVNGKKVEKARLNNGDRVEIGEGGPVFEFRTGEENSNRGPSIAPLSGAWDEMDPIDLVHGSVTLGRAQENDIVVGRIHGSVVSSRHAEIRIHRDSCEIDDLDSSNGLFVNDRKVRHAPLHDGDRVELGEGGPRFKFIWRGEPGKRSGQKGKLDDGMLRRIEKAAKGGPAGDSTRLMLKIAKKYHKHRRRPYVIGSVIAVVLAAGAFAGALVYFQRAEQLNKMMKKFYDAREARAELLAKPTASEQEKVRLRDRQRELEEEYDKYLEKVGWYTGKTLQQKAVMKMARRLGEVDLDIPEGFFEEVMKYVAIWKRAGNSLHNAMQRACQKHLLAMIRVQLDQRDLPQEFLFIPLQESNYNPEAVGKPTRFGVAKGMWQLIPPTGREYGLEIGPYEKEDKYDASDMRHDAGKSTIAATQFLSKLYSTKAAASGMLVIASYNYGPSRITKNLDELPNEPKFRSFWYFYRNQWLPQETREYVFRIISAALIYENPGVFGFDLEPCS